MQSSFDRAISVSSILLSIVAVVIGITTDYWIVAGLLILFALGVPVFFFFYLQWVTSLPPFTVIRSLKTVTIHDADGRNATIRKELTLRANHNGIQYFTHRNISSDGIFYNFRNEFGNAPPELVVRRDVGDWEATTFFPDQLTRGQEKTTWVEYGIRDGYLNPQERSRVIVDGEYKHIRVKINSPHRPFHDGTCIEYFSGVPVKQIPLNFNQDRTEIDTCVGKPKKGAIYKVEWTW